MPTLNGRNWQLNELRTLWTPVLEARLALAGSTATILPMGMPAYGKSNATTFTGAGETQPVFTWSEAPSAFDTPLDLNLPASFQGVVPFVDFNGTDEEADSPSAAYWQAVGAARSIVAWINPDVAAVTRDILTKYDSTTGVTHREWEFHITSADKLEMVFHDESVNKAIYTSSDAALTEGIWTHIAATYSGSDTAAGIDLYVNGVLVASTDTTEAGFVAVEAKDSLVRLGFEKGTAATQNFFNGKIAGGPCGVLFVQAVLTADQLLRDYHLGRGLLGV